MRQVMVKLLKDGSGRICIHWAIRDPKGSIHIPNRVLESSLGPIQVPAQNWRTACNPAAAELNRVVGGVIHMEPHSDDVRAVTCPACRATEEFKKEEAELAELAKV